MRRELGKERKWARMTASEEYERLCESRLESVLPVREPLVLVSQVFRSGGTLLSQLFDGHPECHAHPHELRIAQPTSRDWPQVDLDAPGSWFDLLYEKYAGKHFRQGYRKTAAVRSEENAGQDVFPFLFPPRLQQRVFEQCVAQWRPSTRREVLDCYFTSYFNAWLDNQNLYSGPKRVVTAFAPELNLRAASVTAMFDDYPDGTLISIVREPRAWFVSATKQKPHLDLEHAMKKWCKSVDRTLQWRDAYEGRVHVITYEDLVRETERTMSRLAERIGISMSDALLVPTFNGRPIRANSRERVERYGVLTDRTETYRVELDAETIERVESLAGDRYERVREVTLTGI